MTPVTFALIGAGGIAQSYATAFENHPDARLAAVVDVRPEAAAALAARFACPAFASPERLLESGTAFDAVVLCTPPDTHESITLLLVRRGIHVLCEKPFTFTGGSARTMARAAEQAGALLTMGSKFRYVADVLRAKELIASGLVGDVVLFENAFTARVDMTNRWNAVPAISGGGVLIDNGTHSVDIMRYFLGPLAEVHAVEGKNVQGLLVEDTARLFVRSHSGIMGSVDLSWSINKELDWYVNIYGSLGTIQIGWKSSRYKVTSGREWVTFGTGYDKVQAFRDQVANFARAIRGTEPLRITWEDAVASVEVVEAAYQSLRASAWTGIETPMAGLSSTPLSLPTLAALCEARHG
jgi:predicted dehydrogenase